MYEPHDKDEPKYFIFKHVSGRLIPGFGPVQYAIVATVLAVGIVLFSLSGLIKTETTKTLSPPELAQQHSENKILRNQLYSLELEEGLATPTLLEEGEASYVYVGEDPAVIEEIQERARARKITSSMSDEDLEKLTQTTKTISVELIPMFLRIALFLAAPLLITVSLFIEVFQGFTLLGEIRRWLLWRREQKLFRYRPKSYGSGV